ncbi:MarR family winged helix-turn-helix transcriptional regulator [Actinomadura flavalba]|uniref:MarR family winged helix-turn-helix transcriptional regulator n=1 Tax=Actinomadura flavalba TaxID=1120938 RepID=UPI0003618F78|nr:MarR family transcriptional regulator [Actinomadura flavalba]
MDDDALRPPTLLGLPAYLAVHVARIAHRPLVDALAAQGLRLPHFAVLAALGDFGPLAQHEIAERLALGRSHLVGYLDDLADGGHIVRERDPADRRRQRVALREPGAALLASLIDIARASEAERLSVLSDDEQRTLVALLRRVVVADDAARAPEM